MKNILIIFSILFLSQNTYAQTWVREKNKDGIIISTKQNPKYRMKSSRAEMYTTASPEKVVNAIFNVVKYLEWMPDCEKIEILKSNSANDIIYYAMYKTPWPAANRDMILNVKKVKTSSGFKIEMANKSNYVEVSQDAVRVPVYFGTWTISKTDKGTKVFLEYQTDPGGSVPAWMTEGAAVNTPYDMFASLKKYVE